MFHAIWCSVLRAHRLDGSEDQGMGKRLETHIDQWIDEGR